MDEKEKESISQDQVFEVVEFANRMYTALDGLRNGDTYGYGVYTPQTQNRNLINLNNNQIEIDYESVTAALSSVKNSAEALQSYSEFMEYFDAMYNKVLNHYSTLLSFDYYWECTNAYGSDWDSLEFKEDEKRIMKFCDQFKVKAEFSKALKEMIRHETHFVWYRGEGNLHRLQTMPQRECLITKDWEYGLLYDFDMSYFLDPSVPIDSYPDIFKTYFKNVFDTDYQTYKTQYNPDAPLKMREGVYATTTQTSPNEGAWVFKLDMSNSNAVPFLTTLLRTMLTNNDLERLQYNKNMISAYALLMGEIKTMEKSGAEQSDKFTISPMKIADFMSLVRASMPSNLIKTGALPLENTKLFQYDDKNPNMYSNQLKTSAALSAAASRMIYADDKMSQSEVENAIISDYNIIKKAYEQFENFMTFFANKKTRTFKFQFKFIGSNYPFERQNRIANLDSMIAKGCAPDLTYIAATYGIEPQTFIRMMDRNKSTNLIDKLTLLPTAYTQSGENTGGRPQKTGTLRSESRDYDSTE